jgi:hypothetical protein
MKQVHVSSACLILLLCSVFCQAQQTVATNINAAVPPLVNFSGTLTDADGKPMSGTVAVTFSLYSEQTGGAALWMETQNVQPDNHGHYTVMLGSTSSTGLPSDIFVAGEAHWLGVQVDGAGDQQAEQTRVLLVSAPYALKAGDAQTLGGLPASAFVLATPPTSAATTASPDSAPVTPTGSVMPATTSDVTTTGGSVDAIPLFSTATSIQNSLLSQTGTSAVNLAGKLNLPATGTATAAAGKNSQPQDFVTSVFDSATAAAVPQTFQFQAEPASNDTASPSGTLNLLYGSGTATPAETGLKITNKGLVTFATGQTFPGVADLTGPNTFTGNQTVTGTVTATSSTSNGIVGASLSGYGVEGIGSGLGANTGVYGNSGNGVGVEGYSTTGVAGLFSTTPSGTLIKGINNEVTEFTVDNNGNITTKGGINAGSIVGTGPNATSVGVEGISTGPSGYGVYGSSPNVGLHGLGTGTSGIGVDGHGPFIGVKGIATASGGFSGSFGGGPVQIAGNTNYALLGDPGCGSGYAGLGFTTGTLSGCTNYALLGGPAGDTFINSSGTATIHFRSNNNELVTINNDGNVDVIGQNGGGNLTVAGRVTSGNVIAAVTASNGVSLTSCSGFLTSSNTACAVPNMTLTKTTEDPSVLVMVSIGGVVTDQCATANFYLVVDGKISALSTISLNSNNSALGDEIGNLNMVSLLTLSAGSHTFQVQEATDETGASCGTFTLDTGVSQGDGGRGSQRSLIVREF